MEKEIKTVLTKRQYREFIRKILEHNSKKGRLPESIELNDKKINKQEYIEAIEQVNKFRLENGRYPERVNIYVKHHSK